MSDPSATSQAVRVRARRNLRLVAVGVLAVCVGGVGMAWLYTSVADARSVVSVTRTVYRGQLITQADLGVLSVPSVPGLETVPADAVDDVIGQAAHTDLVAGSVLSPRSFGAALVEAGTARLGLRLAPGRMPSTELPPGTAVLLVGVARDGGEPPEGASVVGRVAAAAIELPDGAALLDVTVPQDQAERVARLAAGDQIVVVRQSETQR